MLSSHSKIAILAGGGLLPKMLIQHCRNAKKDFHVITFTGQPKPDIRLKRKQHTRLGLLQIQRVIDTLNEHQITEVVMAGALKKPRIWEVIPDRAGKELLKQAKTRHDDELLKLALKKLSAEGFHIVSAQEIDPDLITPVGELTKRKPTVQQQKDIQLGRSAAIRLGQADIGQAVIVQNHTVVGVEGVEGTDALIERCASLRSKTKGGILVKMAKPNQTELADLPTIGLNTIKQLKKYKYAGVAIEANRSICLERDKVVKAAQRAGLFIIGIRPPLSDGEPVLENPKVVSSSNEKPLADNEPKQAY